MLLTDEQIEALRAEAGEASDHAQCAICDVATGRFERAAWVDLVAPAALARIERMGLDAARSACARVILEARG